MPGIKRKNRWGKVDKMVLNPSKSQIHQIELWEDYEPLRNEINKALIKINKKINDKYFDFEYEMGEVGLADRTDLVKRVRINGR